MKARKGFKILTDKNLVIQRGDLVAPRNGKWEWADGLIGYSVGYAQRTFLGATKFIVCRRIKKRKTPA